MVLTLDYDYIARKREKFFDPIYDFLFNLEKFGICDVLKKNPVSAPVIGLKNNSK